MGGFMPAADWIIVPGRGVGPVLFGMRKQDVEKVAGSPSQILAPDDDGDVCLRYDDLGMSLYLDADDELRLSIIELVAEPHFRIGDRSLLGLSEAEAKVAFAADGVRFESDETCGDEVEWKSSKHAVSLYCVGGRATGVSMNVLFGEDDQAQWPFP